MMKFYSNVIVLIILSLNVYSQQLSGYVRDSQTGENLVGAYIFSENYSVLTNEYGFFVIDAEHILNDTIDISFIGYTSQTIAISSLDFSVPLIVKLQPNMILPEVIIKAPVQKNPDIGVTSLSYHTFSYLPKIGGETNIIRAIHLLPGINAGSEGKSNFHVRGGGTDQNLILLDDIPIYYINHLGGFVSVFDAEIISRFNFYKGTSPAKYGGRLSSVLDIRTRDGNMKTTKFNGTVGLLSSRFSIEGPVKIDTSSYIISLRRSMYELFTIPYFAITENDMQFSYSFYDMHLKYNRIINPQNRVYINFFRGYDSFTRELKQERSGQVNNNSSNKKWGNMLASVRYNYSTKNSSFFNFTSYFSEYSNRTINTSRVEYVGNISEYYSEYFNTIQDIGFTGDFQYSRKKYDFEAGAHYILHSSVPNKIIDKQQGFIQYDSVFNAHSISSFETVGYIDNSIQLWKRQYVKIGLRASQFAINNKTFFNVEPRILSAITLFSNTELQFFYGIHNQYIHYLQAPELEDFGVDLWIPASSFAPPETSNLTSLSLSHILPSLGVDCNVEVYRKTMSNLIEYKENSNYNTDLRNSWEQHVETDGLGSSQGIEVTLTKKSGRINGWISYTLAKSTREFEHINNGKPYIYSFDSKHAASWVLNYALADNLVFSCTWIYYSGRAYTVDNELFEVVWINGNEYGEINTQYIEKASEKNNAKMAPYHRLDLNLSYTIEKKKSKRVWNFSIYNAYNRQNAYSYHYQIEDVLDEHKNPTGETKKTLYQYTLFPFIPSVSYGFYF